jgi:hypothetical protein
MKTMRADLAAGQVMALSEDEKHLEVVHVGVPVIVLEGDPSEVIWQGDPVPRTPLGFQLGQMHLRRLQQAMTEDWQEVHDKIDWRILFEAVPGG